jgi:AcrR family transcriptional regulator
MTETRRQRDPKAKLTALHNSAFALMAEERYEDVSVAKIATHANVAVGTLYRFYPTKMALLEAMSDALEDEFVLTMRTAWQSTPSYPEKMAQLCNNLFVLISERAAEIGVMQITAGHRSKDSKPMGQSVRNEIARLFADGVKHGNFEPHDPSAFAAAAHGMVEGVMREYLMAAVDTKKEYYIEMLTGMMQKLVAR